MFSLNGLSNAWFISEGMVSIGIISAGGGVLYKIITKEKEEETGKSKNKALAVCQETAANEDEVAAEWWFGGKG